MKLKKILIIENDLDTLDMIGYLFGDGGYEVVESQVSLPIEKIIEANPDLIILDYWLNDGYGNDICLDLKTTPGTKDIPIILISASLNLKQIAENCFADECLEKPFNIGDLESLVRELTK